MGMFDNLRDKVKKPEIISKALDSIKSLPGKYRDTVGKANELNTKVRKEKGFSKFAEMVKTLFSSKTQDAINAKEKMQRYNELQEVAENRAEAKKQEIEDDALLGIVDAANEAKLKQYDDKVQYFKDENIRLKNVVKHNSLTAKEKFGLVAGTGAKGAVKTAEFAGGLVVTTGLVLHRTGKKGVNATVRTAKNGFEKFNNYRIISKAKQIESKLQELENKENAVSRIDRHVKNLGNVVAMRAVRKEVSKVGKTTSHIDELVKKQAKLNSEIAKLQVQITNLNGELQKLSAKPVIRLGTA